MNAAFLLVTSACFAGQTPAPAATPPAAAHPAPVVSTANPGSCGGCDTCCGTSRHRLFGGGGGLFHRNSCGCDGGCGCATTVTSCNTCSTGHSRSWGWHSSSSCCTSTPTCTTSCDTCGGGHGGGFLSRCRGMFAGRGHGSSCCDGGCGTIGCTGCTPSGIPAAPAPAGELIPTPPKKMPAPPKTTPPAKTTAIPTPQGITIVPAPAIAPPPATSAPIIEVVPPTVPAVPSITTQPRSPF